MDKKVVVTDSLLKNEKTQEELIKQITEDFDKVIADETIDAKLRKYIRTSQKPHGYRKPLQKAQPKIRPGRKRRHRR